MYPPLTNGMAMNLGYTQFKDLDFGHAKVKCMGQCENKIFI